MNKTYIIYLASGNSRRFKGNKLLFPFQNKPLYQHALDRLLKEYKDIIVVSQYDEILQYASQRGALSILCLESIHGLSYSIKAAVNYLNTLEKPFQMIFMVADQPYISMKTIEKLIHSTHTLASCAYKDKVGNPTLFDSSYIPELLLLKEDQGGRKVLNKHPDEVEYIQIENIRELYDIDYQEDLKQLQ